MMDGGDIACTSDRTAPSISEQSRRTALILADTGCGTAALQMVPVVHFNAESLFLRYVEGHLKIRT